MASDTVRRQSMNEHRRRLFGDAGRPLALVCECADEDCQETVLLTVEEYDARRPGPIIASAHAEGAGIGVRRSGA